MTRSMELYRAIRRIGWAYVLFHLDLNVPTNVGSGQLDLLPSFFGFLLILHELGHIQEAVPSAGLLRPLAWGLLVFELDGFFAGAFGASLLLALEPLGGLKQLVELLFSMLRLYFHFQMLTDLADAAHAASYPGEKSLLNTRTWYTVLLTVVMIASGLRDMPVWIPVGVLVLNLAAAIFMMRAILKFGKWGLNGG